MIDTQENSDKVNEHVKLGEGIFFICYNDKRLTSKHGRNEFADKAWHLDRPNLKTDLVAT